MTIEEIKAYKALAEASILKIIQELEAATGMVVDPAIILDRPEVHIASIGSFLPPLITDARVCIKLELP